MDRATRAKLNEERQEIERLINAFRALDREQDGSHKLTDTERKEYQNFIYVMCPKGNPIQLMARYIEIQNLQWADFTGRPIPGGEPHLSLPDDLK